MATIVSGPATADRRQCATALVVEPSAPDALALVSVITRCGFDVTVAGTFGRAKEHLGTHVPDLLVTAVRLAEYNGLHLVLRATAVRMTMAALVVSDCADPVLQAEADAMGATFVIKPVSESELSAAVFRTLGARLNGSAPSVIRPPFERRLAQRRSVTTPVETDRRAVERRQGLSLVPFTANRRVTPI
jgi:DNA-binding response OmpR family regulator